MSGTGSARATRSASIRGSPMISLVGLSNEEVQTLENDFGIKNLDDIATLEKDDFNTVLGNEKDSFMKRRRLFQISIYLRKGGRITATTTMRNILEFAHSSVTSDRASGTAVKSGGTSPIKLSPNDVPEFSGDIKDQEKYRTQIEAMVGQTAFKFLLNRDADTPDEKERDEELYNVFKASFHDGTAYHLIGSSLVDADGNEVQPSGRRVWKNFLKWCNSGGRKDTLRKKLEEELEDLKLDGDTVDGFDYVNSFITKHNALKQVGVTKTINIKMQRFVDNIKDNDFDVVQQTLEGKLLQADRDGTNVDPQEFFDRVETRQRALTKQANQDMDVKSRRQQFQRRGRNNDSRGSGYSSDTSITSNADNRQLLTLPPPLFKSLSQEQKKAFNKWRKGVKDGSSVEDDVYAAIMNNKQGKSGTDKKGGSPPQKKKSKYSRTLKIRRAVSSEVAKTTSEEVQFLMKSDDDDSEEDECQSKSTPQLSKKDRKIATTKIIRKSAPTYSRTDKEFNFQTILDSGTEWTVIGGPAWTISCIHKRSLNIAAVDSQMPTVKTPLCDAITAVKSENGEVKLIGVRRCGYSPSLNEDEAVINSHFLREAGWSVDGVAKRHGGSQSLSIRDIVVPLEYNATCYKMYVSCRSPTADELKLIPIHWINCHVEDLDIDDGKKPVRRRPVATSLTLLNPDAIPAQDPALTNMMDPGTPQGPLKPALKNTTPLQKVSLLNHEDQGETSNSETAKTDLTEARKHINWNLTLGHCNDDVVLNTLKNTTQYFAEPVESEVRAYPRQHRQRRLHPLHFRRIQGRTAGDTFFSSIRSIRGYTCVQLFVALTFDYLWIQCLRRESQVPGAYQDFCREVGAPNELLTDNSKVQSGNKFKTINRENITEHNFSTPHCQNQNPAERKIQDVKHRAILVLFSAAAPLTFWCYAIEFVVDCLNHTSKKRFNGKTSKEYLSGNTPDISVFRYSFWQPIEYLDPHAKFPDCKWKPGRFVGIAWKHGDPLTYRIWTEPEAGGWQKGLELVRNVVRPRKDDKADKTLGACTKSEIDEFAIVPGRQRHNLEGLIKQRKKRTRAQANGEQKGRKKRKKNSTTTPSLTTAQREGVDSGGDNISRSVTFADQMDLTSQQEEMAHNSLEINQDSIIPIQDEEERLNDLLEQLNNEDDSTNSNNQMDANIEINNELDPSRNEDLGSSLVAFNGQRWMNSKLQLRALMPTGDTQWVDFRDAKEDYPRKTATFIVEHYKSRSKKEGRDRIFSWAKTVLRKYDRAVRRVARLYDFVLDDHDNIRRVRRSVRAKKKKQSGPPPKRLKYGVQVPRTVKEAINFDNNNNNTLWQDAMKKEMQALYELDCFEFKDSSFKPGMDFQKTRLHMIFDVKNDLRRKARLVAGGHLVDLFDTEVYSSTVKGISVKLLHVISHHKDLKALCGDVGNAFVTAETRESVYCIAGLEFGEERQGQVVLIRKALYGLASSAACFHAHFADTLRSFGFRATRFDQDVWIKLGDDGTSYDYICTHVDDFCIFSKKPQPIMDQIKSIFTVKSEGPPEYYLGNDYRKDRKGRWNIGCRTYIKEGIARVEKLLDMSLSKHDTPMTQGDHPELDDSVLLDDDDHTKYQMLIGMLNWIVTIGRIDIAFAVTSLSRFVASPRHGHLLRVLHVFGYLKKKFNKRIVVDSREPIVVNNGAEGLLDIDLTEKLAEHYPDAKEEIDDKVPEPLLDELKITAYVDSDHAHDKVSRRSMTGLIIFVGRTPVFYMAKRQGAIETSTYGAEFIAMKTAVEEVISVRYMLRCLGVRVTKPTHIMGDNRSVILNSTLPSSLLKKKHIAIAYHKTREAAAAGIVHPLKTKGDWNFADVCTKSQTRKIHATLVGGMMT